MNETPVPDPRLKDRAVFTAWTTDRVRYNDLDPNNHVNNNAINQFFEDGRVSFREDKLPGEAGSTLAGFVVVKFSAEYLAPVSYPGEVEVGTVILRVGRTSYTLGQGVFQGDTCVAVAEVVTVTVDPATAKPRVIEGALRASLEENLIEG